VVVVASLAWGTEDRWRRGRGLAEAGPGLPCFFLFFSFFCAVSIWVAHGKERVTPSRWGRPSTPFLCRASHITHGNELCRVLPFPKAHGKVLYRVKLRRVPFAVRLGKMRMAKAVPCVFLSLSCAAGARQRARFRWCVAVGNLVAGSMEPGNQNDYGLGLVVNE
jgi:hypothetical protein